MQHGHLCLVHLHESGTPQKKEDEQSTRLGPKKTIYTAVEIKMTKLDVWRMGCFIGVSHFQKEEKQG
jgi:hypothetical protein